MENSQPCTPNLAHKQPNKRRFLLQTGAISIILNTENTEQLTDLEKFIVEFSEIPLNSTILRAFISSFNNGRVEKREFPTIND